MPWTAEKGTVERYAPNPFMVRVPLILTSDLGEVITDNSIISNNPTEDYIAMVSALRIKVLEERDVALATILPGPVILPPKETKEEADARLAANVFFAKSAELKSLKTQAEKGFIKPDDPAIAAAEAEVKSLFLPEYAKDTRFK